MLPPHHLLLSLIGLLGCCIVVEAGAPYFKATLWTSPIPYTINSVFNETVQANIRAAVQEIADNTCIDFIEGVDGPNMEFVESEDDVCQSSVGDTRNGKNHKVEIREGCLYVQGIQHELYHALGFYHEHQRPDRDNYVTFHPEYIKTARDHAAFDMVTVDENTTDYGIPYDFGSLIHYATSNGFTLIDGDYYPTINGKNVMAYNDWKMINLHYKCSDKCPEKKICQNGGYQHPRDCNLCVCPRFYEGDNCEIERHPHTLKPGEALRLNYGWQFNKSTYRSDYIDQNPDLYNLESSPARIIRASEGSRIKVTINNIFDNEIKFFGCQKSCPDKALEIVDGDLTRTGKRFCCNKTLPYSFVSETNVVGYHVYAITGLNFVANVTFTVEGSGPLINTEPLLTPTTEPETTVDETGTEQLPYEPEITTTSAPWRYLEKTAINPEDYPSDTLFRLLGMFCHCGDDGIKCDPNPSHADMFVWQTNVDCECHQPFSGMLGRTCKPVPQKGSAN